ncbi:MAG: murein biosynthesis integral membrane protein MurJ [Candidatus Yanofskybacteria bacterium]|nr:murein biosynthesis integral membrane protein MurJ [Candidatus Yanofskybacteria bacterium]
MYYRIANLIVKTRRGRVEISGKIQQNEAVISRIFSSQAAGITSASLILAASALLSRLFGLLRDRLLAGMFGAGEELDMYFAAFRIPDFIFAVFVLGGLSAVFLPLFSEYREKNSKEAWEFVSNLLHVLVIALGALALVLALFAPYLIGFVAPGFTAEQRETAASLTRIMLLSPILFGMSSVFSGVLHYFNRFFAYALAPVVYNLGILGGIFFFAPSLGIWGVAWGVVAGAFLHLAIQVPAALVSGFSWKPKLDIKNWAIRRALALALPRTIGGTAYEINLIAMTAFASFLSAGSIAVFTFADNLQHAPVGFIGVSLALASFPVLSRAYAAKQKEGFQDALLSTARKVVFLVFPISVFLFLFREYIVRLIFRTGVFGSQDVQLVAAVFGVFTLGIVFQALIPLFVRAFFALQDTKTPTLIGIASVCFNILAAFVLFQAFAGFENMRILALPAALVASGFLQCLFLAYFLWKKTKTAF